MNQQYLMLAIIVIVVGYFFMGNSNNKLEAFSEYNPSDSDAVSIANDQTPISMLVDPSPPMSSDDLLPSDFTEWAKLHPTGTEELNNRNFLTSGHHIGINTVGQSLRNPNLQIRSEPPNPQVVVSPWSQSTIGPDLNRKPLEINENNPVEYYDL